MVNLGKNAFDNASRCIEMGAESCRWFGNLVVTGTISSESGGGEILANNTWLQWMNAAGTTALDVLKVDASNNTVLNALLAKAIDLKVNGTTVVAVAGTGATVTGTLDATGIATAAAYHLSDGSDKNYNLEVYAVGTAYQFTNAQAALTFGTTSPAVTIDKAGVYLLFARVNVNYNAATFAAVRTLTLKLRRTNNSAADVSNSTMTAATQVITTLTFTMGAYSLPPVLYTTTNTNDAIAIFGGLDTAPTAGSLDAVEASIVAVRISAT
jgi:hypothetical protein